ncbi:MAG: hypothetical protein WC820_08710 [Spirochaetales bacterium]|jgi:ATP-dependent RNA helicase RhlB
MDLSRFSIDAALFSSAEASNAYRSVFYERLLSGLIEKDENLFVRTDIQKEREQIFAFPALYWLTRIGRAAERGRALYLCFDDVAAAAACEAAVRMANGNALVKPALLVAGNEESEEVKGATLLFATVQTFHDLLPSGLFMPRDFGFVIADQAEQIAELPGEFLRKLQGNLLPSWERKSLIIANKHTPKAKNFAWEFGDSPREIKLGETMGYAGTTSTISRDIKEADKIGFILQLLVEGENRHLCVFCNLKSTAAELSARMALNGVTADYIAGNLNPDRKNQIVTKALAWTGQRRPSELAVDEAPANADGGASEVAVAPPAPVTASGSASRFAADSFVLVLTDDGAKGLSRPEFITVVNYDLPLEPEFYFERLNFLKRQDPSARLYNLVCERYMYGLPAIERMIDASLSVVPLDPDVVLPEDLSAGKTIEMPEPRFRGRGDRHGGDDRRGGGDRYERPNRPERPDRPPEGHDRVERERPERPERSPAARTEARRAPSPGGPRRDATDRGGVSNPYAMSMEERLALYKKKYGKQLEQGPSGQPGGDPRRRGRPGAGPRNPDAAPRGGRQAGGRGPRRDEQAGARPLSEGRGADKVAAPPLEPTARSEQPKPETEAVIRNDKARGLLGKLQDFFGSHKD